MKTTLSSTLRSALVAVVAGAAGSWAASAYAQVQPPNNPPAGAYQPIPNFSGPGAGLLFRRAINDRFSGAAAIAPAIVRLPLASLPPVMDGMMLFCTDCKRANPCATGGTGAWATGARGEWRCAEGPLEADFDAAGKKLTNLGTAAASGDAIAFGQAGAKIGDVADSGATDGSNTISQFSINGVKNVRNWGATASSTTTTATTDGDTTITVASNASFAVGQGVKIHRAGASATIATPTGITVTRQSYNLNPDPTGSYNDDVCQTTGWTTGGAGSVTHGNANCTTTHRYAVIAIDSLNGWSAPTATTQITDGPATLSAANRIKVSWDATASAAAYGIYRCTGAACTPTLKAVIPANFTQYIDASTAAWASFAIDADFSGALQGGTKAQDLLTTITAISGTDITLAAAAAQTGSFTMRHDDGVAFNTVLNSMCATGGELFVPAGTYPIATSINLAQNPTQCAGVRMSGIAAPRINNEGTNAALSWVGPLGGTVIDMDRGNAIAVENLAVHGSVSTPAIAFDLDRNEGSGTPSHNRLEHIYIGQAGVGIAIARNGNANNELHIFNDVTIDATNSGAYGGYIGVYIGGASQTNNERFYNLSLSERTYLFNFSGVGHAELYSPNYGTGVYAHAGGGGEVHIIGATSEGNQMFWAESSPQRVVIESSQIYPETALNGYGATFNGSVTMIGTVFCLAEFPCKLGLQPGIDGSYFIDNRFSDAAPLIDYQVTTTLDLINFAAFGNKVKQAQDQVRVPQTSYQDLYAKVNGFNIGFHQGAANSLKTAVLGTPGQPQATVEGTPGATTIDYYAVCEDANGGQSVASTVRTITNANAVLDTTNRVRVSLNNSYTPGYAKCYILKNGTSGNVLLGSTTTQANSDVYDVGQSLTSFTTQARNNTADVTLPANSQLTIGGGTAIKNHLSATASLDYDLSAAGITCQDLTITVTGAADGDTVGLGVPNALASSAGVVLSGFVSSANTVTVRACDVTSSNPDPAGATVRADVWQH